MPFAIQSANGFHLATLSGALDSFAGQEMVAGIKGSATARGAKVILDCTGMSQMDMSGFRSLLSLLRWVESNEVKMIVAGMSPENWQIIVDNHCGDRFESRPSVPAALQALGINGVQPSAQPEPGQMGAGDTWESVEDTFPSAPPEPVTYVDPFQSAPSPAAAQWPETSAGGSTWDDSAGWGQQSPGISGSLDDQWGQYERQTTSPASSSHVSAAKAAPFWKRNLVWFVVSTVLLVAVGAWIFVDWMRLPEIEVSESSVKIQEGQEASKVLITVKHGRLDVEAAERRLPRGLYIGEPQEIEGVFEYTLNGVPATGEQGEHGVELTAVRGGKRSMPKELAVTVEEKPMEWQLRSPPTYDFVKGKPLAGYQRLVTGAVRVTPTWNLPTKGLEVQADRSNPKSWSLSGTPADAGQFKLSLVAESKGGKRESRVVDVNVVEPPDVSPVDPGKSGAIPVNPSPPVSELNWNKDQAVKFIAGRTPVNIISGATSVDFRWMPAEPEGLTLRRDPRLLDQWSLAGLRTEEGEFTLEVTAQTSAGRSETRSYRILINRESEDPVPITSSAIGNRMRDLLMERIERANEHFTSEDKSMLRQMVGYLDRPRRVGVVNFGNGESRLSGDDKARLRQTLRSHEDGGLLNSADWQIMVVGYASRTGSMATNVRLSKERAQAVNDVLVEVLGRGADLCGDYGPTDVLSPDDQAGNRAVEIYAGKLTQLPSTLRDVSDRFKRDFNDRHGLR